VLKLATLSAAEHFGLADELGTVERGKLADFFLVPGDPTQDLQVLRRARVVVKGGTVLFPAEIHAALAFEPFAAPPPIRE
jgi:imidazolonepropionase-like amidohydrolase